MRPTSLLILFLFAVGLAGAPGFAGAIPSGIEDPATKDTVTEEIFLAAVDSAHPASQALAGELGSAEARRLQASLLEEPRFDFVLEDLKDLAVETTYAVAWAPPIDGRRKSSIRVAEAGVDVETHRLEAQLVGLRFTVREAYAAWAVGEARVSLLAKHSGRLETLAQRMGNRAEAGEDSVLAARRMEIAFARSNTALSVARAETAAWRERVASWLVDGALDLLDLEPELPNLPLASADLGSDGPVSAETRPDVLAARAEVEKAESLGQLSKHVIEAPEFLLGWKTLDNDLAGGERDFDGPVFAFGWKLPVFDRRRADRLAAESALDAAVAGEEWATRRARSELAATLVAYDELRQSADTAWNELESLNGVGRAAEASFEAGESTVTDLLDALRALLEARLAALDLYAATLEAHRRLEVATGRPLTSGDLS